MVRWACVFWVRFLWACRYKNCDDTVKAMEDSVGFAHSEHLMNATHRQEFNKQVEMMKAEMKMRLEQMELASRGGGGMMSLLSGFGDEYVVSASPCVVG